MNKVNEVAKEAPTPEDITPEQREIRNFKRSPLARRISDDILNPRTTRELLRQKKFQFDRMLQDKFSLQQKVSQSYFFESVADAYHAIKMPSVRILASKFKPTITMQETSYSDIQALTFPNISEVFWSKLETTGWKPETRQHSSLTCLQNKLYLIGGVSRSIISDVNVFAPGLRKWEKLCTSGVETEPRFGHTVVEHNKKLIIFGGGTDFNSIHKQRECLNGVKAFVADSREWESVRSEGDFIGTRKHHCAAIIGKHMLIQGGLNQRNNILNDSAILNLKKSQWKIVSFKGPGPGFTAFHTAASILDVDQRSTSSLYKLPPSKTQTIQQPGIYIFGGLNEDRHAVNNLYLLNVGCKSPFWTRPETVGQAPSPRFQHSMAFNEKLNVLVVFGGRIDVRNANAYTCFNDLYLLRMDSLMWITVQVLGNVPSPRSGHCFVSCGTKVYLFAGVGTNTYCSSDLYFLELHPKVTRQMIEDEEKRKVKEVEMEIIKARRASMSVDERTLGLY